LSFGYLETGNSSYRKSALVFERSETHGQGANASGKIHFLLNNNSSTSATALTDAVLTIDSVSGNTGSSRVGISTRFPAASLHISGSVASDNLMRIQSSTGAEYLFVSASGNVGIGTNSPGARLDIAYTTNPTTATPHIILTTGGTVKQAAITAESSVVSGLVFSTGDGTLTDRMTILRTNGNVGIGTTSPNAKLDVNGNALVTGSLTIAPTAGNIELSVASTGVKIGNALTDNHSLTGSLNMPYTSSGVIILDDPTSGSVYNNSDNYIQPQIRIKGTAGVTERTGISILKNQEVHLVSSAKAIFGVKTLSTIPRAIMASDVWLHWSNAETDTFSPDTTIRRISAGVLQITSSLIATSFTGSLQGTASYALAAPAASNVTFNRVTASYTFVLADAGKTVEVSGSSNTTYNLTVPAASTTNFADGTYIDVVLYGSGSIQFVTASGVTFRSANNWTKLGTRYGAATLINIAGDEWYLIGNLNA
jgi:hypothetical protein